ncbi:MAG: hypothetical protein JWO36_4245 [Myxococcales bacterium]|nr:hypothetical protein [Myxococcales bacterium]
MRALVASIVLMASSAQAGGIEDNALEHLDRGVAAYHAGDYPLAHRETELARDLVPDKPNPYRWLALIEDQQADCKRALVNVESFLSRVPKDDPRVAEIIAVRDKCANSGALRIGTTPSGAAIRIDGSLVGTSPYRGLAMRSGPHLIAAEKAGFEAAAQSIIIKAAEETAIDFRLTAHRKSITREWWFWTAVGAVAITAAGVTYGLTRDSESQLPAIHCDQTGCHP